MPLDYLWLCLWLQRAITVASRVTSSVTVQTPVCRRPTVVLATTVVKPGTWLVIVPTSRQTTASATTAELSDTSLEIVRREEAAARPLHPTMIALPATSLLVYCLSLTFCHVVIIIIGEFEEARVWTVHGNMLVKFEIRSFNCFGAIIDWSTVHRHTHRHTSNKNSISAIHSVQLAVIIVGTAVCLTMYRSCT